MLVLGLSLKVLSAVIAFGWAGWVLTKAKRNALYITWGLFSFCMGMFLIAEAFEHQLGAWRPWFVMFSGGTCSLAWLFTRSLFRPRPDIGRFELLLVGGIILPSLVRPILSLGGVALNIPPGTLSALLDGIWRAQTLLSSTALMLTLWEVARNWPEAEARTERQIRLTYLVLFGLMVLLNMAVLETAAFADALSLKTLIEGLCVITVYVMCTLALHYRDRHPLSAAKPIPAATDDDVELGRRLMRLLDREELYLNPDLNLSLLANALGETPNRVSRAVTAGLKATNVNQLINRHRIEHAQTRLDDPSQDALTILQIALESGFNSIGPFNRAFKTITDQTPRQYRQARAKSAEGVAAE